jgi:hypothetical protein
MGGSAAAMIASLKANERKRERVRYFDKKPTYYTKTETKKIYSKKLSKKELAKLKSISRNYKIHHEFNTLMAFTISLFLTTGILVFSVYIFKLLFYKDWSAI